MAFDLNAFLQENRKFLAGSAVGLAVFVGGLTVISSVYGKELEQAKFDVRSGKGKAPKEPLFTKANYQSALAQEEKLAGSVNALSERLHFTTRPEFLLQPGGASPANQYLDIASRMRERRTDDARSRGIEMNAESVGMPDRAPTQPEEIQRILRGLDLVDRVVEMAIRAGIRSFERISVIPEKAGDASGLFSEEIRVEFEIRATSRALSALLELTQESNPPLTIGPGFEAMVMATGARGVPSSGEAVLRVVLPFMALERAAEEAR